MSSRPDRQISEDLHTCSSCINGATCRKRECIDEILRGSVRSDDPEVFATLRSGEHFGRTTTPLRLAALAHDFTRPEASSFYPFDEG